MTDDPRSVLAADPKLRPLIRDHGLLSVEPAEDTFRRLIRSITSQQVSTASATAIRERLYAEFEITPEAIRAADRAELRSVGLSRQKAEYVQNIADAYVTRGWSVDYFDGMSDEAVIAELTEIKGIGTWTAKMFLMFCLGRRDVFPVEDLGIRNGMRALYGSDLSPDGMMAHAERWRPYRSIGSRYIWRAVEE